MTSATNYCPDNESDAKVADSKWQIPLFVDYWQLRGVF